MLELSLTLRNDDASLQQDRSQLINQRRPFADEPGTDSVQGLHIELIIALQLDEPHRRTARRFGDCFCVPMSFFLVVHIRPDISRRDQPALVPPSRKYPAEVMGTTAGFHSDDARWHSCSQPDQCLSFHSPAQNHRTRSVKANEATNVFAEINAKHRNLHHLPLRLYLRRTHNAGRRGGPFHKTAREKAEPSSSSTSRE